MWNTVDDHTATAADTFATVVLEVDRILMLFDQPLIDDIEHFQERHVLRHVLGDVPFESTWCRAGGLSPHIQSDLHYL
jgi:hypothetical protein